MAVNLLLEMESAYLYKLNARKIVETAKGTTTNKQVDDFKFIGTNNKQYRGMCMVTGSC